MKRNRFKSPTFIVLIALFIIAVVIVFLVNRQKHILEENYENSIKENIVEEFCNRDSKLDFLLFAQNDLNVNNEALRKKTTLAAIKKNGYDSAILGMWDTTNWDTEWFLYYLGINTVIVNDDVSTLTQLDYYLKRFSEYRQDVNCLFVNVDPYLLKQDFLMNSNETNETLDYDTALRNYFLDYMNLLPGTWFHLILPSYPIEYWQELGYEKTDEILNCWEDFLLYLHWYSNVDVIWLGDKEWITFNGLNYDGINKYSVDYAEKGFLHMATFKYMVDVTNFEESRIELQNNIERAALESGKYNLSNTDILFLGDSTFDYTKENSTSIPGVVSTISGARTYNLSIGGTKVTDNDHPDYGKYSFVPMSELFLYKAESGGMDRSSADFERYLSDDHSNRTQFFVITYGFNDFFSYVEIENTDNPFDRQTYKGALRTGIENILKYNEKINIVLVTPYDVSLFYENYDENHMIYEYVQAMQSVATEYNLLCLNMDSYIKESGVDEKDYISDGIHLSESGNIFLSRALVSLITE